MKKLLTLLVPIILAPAITGCQDKAHSITSIKTLDDAVLKQEINRDQIINLIESKQDFLLEIYSPTCTYCRELTPKLERYTKDTKRLIYTLDLSKVSEDDFNNNLHVKYPDIFDERLVPKVKFIQKGLLTFNFDGSSFDSYSNGKKIFNRHFNNSEIYLANSIDAIKNFEKNKTSYVFATYDMNDLEDAKYTSNYVINESVGNTKKPVILVNKVEFAEKFTEIQSYFNTSLESFIGSKTNGEIKTIDMKTDDGSGFNDLLANL